MTDETDQYMVTLNVALRDEVARSEFSDVVGEMKRGENPLRLVVKSYSRHDTVASALIARANPPLACRSGCSYCCYYNVTAPAWEVLAIANYVLNAFSADRREALLSEARAFAAKARALTADGRKAANMKCPFLENSQCSIYPVRPRACRNHHASDVEGCIYSFENPEGPSAPNTYDESVFSAGKGFVEAFAFAMQQAGFDSRGYELITAFLEAMSSAPSQKRFAKKKRTFTLAIVDSG